MMAVLKLRKAREPMTPELSRRRLLAASVAILILPSLRAGAQSLDPAPARVQAFYDVLLTCMQQAKDLGVQGRFGKLAPAVDQTFDLATMTRVACGPSWAKLTADRQQALVAAFGRMTAATYANQFNDYNGQQFVVEPGTTPRNADLIVHTRLIPANGDPVTFNYLMRGTDGDWRIEDVYLDGTISQLAVRRSEFTAILSSDGPDGLLAKLQSQSDGLLKGA
jgi:phospholipid transport system substrate-binding protein